jgi:hypothetical protein
MARNYKMIYHRLRAMNAAELAYRSTRNIKARIARLGARPTDRFVLPEQFLRNNHNLQADASVAEQMRWLLQQCRQRAVFPWQQCEQVTLQEIMTSHWPLEKLKIVDAAEQYSRRRFELFHQDMSFDHEIDWHWDPLTRQSIELKHWTRIPYWHSDVARGVKYVWELNRHQHFMILGQAYFLTRHRPHAAALFGQWQHWLTSNPYLFGINWTSSLEAGLRLVSWTWSLQMAKSSDYLTPLFYTQILQSVEQHADYIADNLSHYSSANNHLLGEALGLIYAGCYYPELARSSEWRGTGFAIFFSEFLRQVHSDGVTREQTSHYQHYVFYFALLACLAAEFVGVKVPEPVLERLEKMAEWLCALLDANGPLPNIGDDDGGQALKLAVDNDATRALLAVAAVRFRRSDLKTKAGRLSPEAIWLNDHSAPLVFSSLPAVPFSSPLTVFPDGGYAIFHREQNGLSTHLVLDAGPLGLDRMASHGHADALQVILQVNGEPVLLDSGTFTYRGEPGWRDYFRSSHSHNTVVVDGQSQSEMVGPFQWGMRASARLLKASCEEGQCTLLAQHDGYRHLGVQHERQVDIKQGRIRICDRLTGAKPHDVTLLWHLAPVDYEQIEPTRLRLHFLTFTIDVTVSASVPLQAAVITGQTAPIQGWVSDSFGTKKSNPVFCVTTYNSIPVEIITEIEIVRNEA